MQHGTGWQSLAQAGMWAALTWVWAPNGSVRSVGVLWPLELHLQSLHAYLESVHGLDSRLSAGWVIKAHKA